MEAQRNGSLKGAYKSDAWSWLKRRQERLEALQPDEVDIEKGLWRDVTAALGTGQGRLGGIRTEQDRHNIRVAVDTYYDAVEAMLRGVPRDTVLAVVAATGGLYIREEGRYFTRKRDAEGLLALDEAGGLLPVAVMGDFADPPAPVGPEDWAGGLAVGPGGPVTPFSLTELGPERLRQLAALTEREVLHLLPGLPENLMRWTGDRLDNEATRQAVVEAFRDGAYGPWQTEAAQRAAVIEVVNLRAAYRLAVHLRTLRGQ